MLTVFQASITGSLLHFEVLADHGLTLSPNPFLSTTVTSWPNNACVSNLFALVNQSFSSSVIDFVHFHKSTGFVALGASIGRNESGVVQSVAADTSINALLSFFSSAFADVNDENINKVVKNAVPTFS